MLKNLCPKGTANFAKFKNYYRRKIIMQRTEIIKRIFNKKSKNINCIQQKKKKTK